MIDLIQVRDFKYHFCADGSQIYTSVLTSPLSIRHIDLTTQGVSAQTYLERTSPFCCHFPHLVLISVNGTTIYSVAHIKNLGHLLIPLFLIVTSSLKHI